MAITIPELSSADTLLDTDNIMLTHSNGNSEKIAGSNFVGAGTTCLFTANKTITGPKLKTGLDFKVMFSALITGSNYSDPLTLTYNETPIAVKVNKNGSLSNFTAVYLDSQYKYLQANTILELVYNGTNFIIVGNPVVLSSNEYILRADGTLDGGMVGDVKPWFSSTLPYGWLWLTPPTDFYNNSNTMDTSGSAYELQTKYPKLYAHLGNTNVLPDVREVCLVGAGTNATDSIAYHDVYTLGQFSDDVYKSHEHNINKVPYKYQYSSTSLDAVGGGNFTYYNNGVTGVTQSSGSGNVTHGKQKGVNYIIKAL